MSMRGERAPASHPERSSTPVRRYPRECNGKHPARNDKTLAGRLVQPVAARLERQARDWKHGNGGLPSREATTAATAWLARHADPSAGCTMVGEYVRAARRRDIHARESRRERPRTVNR